MALPFTPTRPLPIDSDKENNVQISFPIIQTGDNEKSCGKVVVITFNNPEKLNAVTMKTMQKLWTYLEWTDEQEQIIITILTGNGRYFSAGADISDPARVKGLPKELEEYPDVNHMENIIAKRVWTQSRAYSTNGMAMRTVFQHKKVLIAALNGPVVGIMASVVALCDLIYCFEDFFLLTPFSQLALIVEAGASVSFPKKMGLGKAQQALIEGKRMKSKELFEAGFISHIFPSHPKPKDAEKSYTPPILQDVLKHVGERLLPPTVDSYSILNTTKLLRQTGYMNQNIIEASYTELQGAENVFRAGRPQKQFERLAQGGRHKL